jgi:hypothetical protein
MDMLMKHSFRLVKLASEQVKSKKAKAILAECLAAPTYYGQSSPKSTVVTAIFDRPADKGTAKKKKR